MRVSADGSCLPIREGLDDARESYISATAGPHWLEDRTAKGDQSDAVERYPVVTVDTQALIRTWDKGVEVLFGHAANEVVGQSLDLIVPPELAEAHSQGFHRAITEPKPPFLSEGRALT